MQLCFFIVYSLSVIDYKYRLHIELFGAELKGIAEVINET